MAECNEGINFCSSCGQRRALLYCSTCAMCGRDFSSSVETDKEPYLEWFRKLLLSALISQPTFMSELHEPNVPIEVFQNIFSEYGRLPDGSTGQLLAIDTNHNDREVLISKRVIWRKEELDSVCAFESIDKSRGHGAAVLLPSGLGCAVLIPPLTVTHYRCSDGEQRLVFRFGHAFLDYNSQMVVPSDQTLDAPTWGITPPPSPLNSPDTTLVSPQDFQSHITESVGLYPAELLRFGIQVPDPLLRSASDMLDRYQEGRKLTVGETRAKKLGEWASKATQQVRWTGGGRSWTVNRPDSVQ